jgi:hypothetical protein
MLKPALGGKKKKKKRTVVYHLLVSVMSSLPTLGSSSCESVITDPEVGEGGRCGVLVLR